ncbi:MAG: hypothetical protein ABIQ39_02350 [Ilumatobacteraceae bacterium]
MIDAAVARRSSFSWSGYLTVMAVGLFLAATAVRAGPKPFAVAVAILLATMLAWLVRPFIGLSLTLLFSLIGDIVTSAWWPFTKSMSSRESIMFVTTSLNISPLDLAVLVGFAALFGRYLISGSWPFRGGPLLRPLLAFTAFILVGLAYGIAKGGSTRIALIEVRPILYLPLMYVLVVSVCRTIVDFRRLLWVAIVAIVIHALLSLRYFGTLTAAEMALKEGIMEHTAALRMNLLFVVVVVVWLFPGTPKSARWLTTCAAVPVIVVYFQSGRRAAIVGLGAALVLAALTLYWRHSQKFWRLVPVAFIIVTGYTGAFWHSTSGAGFPAQALKSVVAPGSVNARDQSSDLYRTVENFDLHYTIRSSKVLGTGFGQVFYRPLPLPDISSYQFYLYVPHNSVLWIWINAGFGGFVALLYLLARTLMIGASRIRRAADGSNLLVVLVGTTFVVMFAVFAYVDISWDVHNMVLLGYALAACACAPLCEEPVAATAPFDQRVLSDV